MTFHLHIKGRVQGVGFRPHVYKCALRKNILGYVINEADGVHIMFNHLSKKEAETFSEEIIKQSPSNAIIQSSHLCEIPVQNFREFSIRVKENNVIPDLLISPDFTMCSQCKKEFHDPHNRRFKYPFITCTFCGPRYSIINQLPYERHLTTMNVFDKCTECQKEYDDVNDRRYFSQTNSCATCGIRLSFQSKYSDDILNDPVQILSALLQAILDGSVIAVKGIGGFLLLCDATNAKAIQTLRERKHRPKKPFAVLFPGIEMVRQFTNASELACRTLQSEASPIVLLRGKEKCFELLDMPGIAPGLSTIGVMLPYAPLLEWIMSGLDYPLVATSGNLSGSCIVFESRKREELFQYADFILDNNREIVIPQDDSVVRIGEKSSQQIIMRRSRGLAPAINWKTQISNDKTIFAAGAMLKSSFAIQHNNQIYLSQFLGNLESYDTQQNYQHTFDHFLHLIKARPEIILTDLHPDYPSTKLAGEYAKQWNTPLLTIQHHEAHFAAILGEHNLFTCNEKVLGIIWDGTGLGNDGNIWGGEFFLYEKGKMKRVHYLEPFSHIAADKFVKEPRLAALAMSYKIEGSSTILEPRFSIQEWEYYQKAIIRQDLQSSSAGRYFDGVAALLNLVNINSYEGEAALLLEQLASDYLNQANFDIPGHYFHEEIDQPVIPMKNVIQIIINDIRSGKNKAAIAAKFHISFVSIIMKVALRHGVKKLAFSGGVFQNQVLIDLIHLQSAKGSEYYFHRQMPPNDECIAFGQIMHHQNIQWEAGKDK